MASAIPSGCARDARQVGRRTWRPRFFLWSSTLRRSCRLRRSLGGPVSTLATHSGHQRDRHPAVHRRSHAASKGQRNLREPDAASGATRAWLSAPSVLWNRRIRALEPKKERHWQVPASARRGGLYKMSGTRRSGRALRCRRGAGDQGQPVPRRDRRGARSMAQRERLHDDSRRAHRAIASGASAHVFSAHAFDKALSQRHGSGSRRPRRLVPPVRD